MLLRPLEPEQYTSIAFTDALVQAGIAGSIGSVGDALDKGLVLEFTEIPIGNLPLYSPDFDANYPPEATAPRQPMELNRTMPRRAPSRLPSGTPE